VISAFRQIWDFTKPFKKDLFQALFCGFILALLAPVLPLLVRLIISGIEGKGIEDVDLGSGFLRKYVQWVTQSFDLSFDSFQLIKVCALTIPIFFLIHGIFRYFHFYYVKFLGEKIVARIRFQVMEKFLNQDVDFLLRTSGAGSGGFLTKILNDALIVQITLPYYADLIREPIIAIGIFSVMLYLNWKITVVTFLFLPIFIVIIRMITKSLRKIGFQGQSALEKVMATLKNSLDGVRVIQSYNLEDHMNQRFQTEQNEYVRHRRRLIKREEIGGPINEWVASFLLAGICLFQAYLAKGGESDTSTFIAFIVAAGMLEKPIKKTQQAVIRLQQNLVSLSRLDEILKSERKVDPNPLGLSFDTRWEKLHFKNISYFLGEQTIFKDLSLEVKRGEVIALVGESGSGKTSLMNLLLRFADPNEGGVYFDGTNAKEFSLKSLRHNIALVSQRVFLFDESIGENIRLGDMNRSTADVSDAISRANARDFVSGKEGGTEFNVGEQGARLSGGEKQRLGIARAIFKDAPILVLDEATSALDTFSEREVQKGLESLIKGRTVFVIAHRLSTIKTADRIVVLKAGQIIEQGSHDELMKLNKEYASLVEIQLS